MGPKVRKVVADGGGVDVQDVQDLFDDLQRCWNEFESIKRPLGLTGEPDGDVERFASAWQVSHLVFPE